MAHLIPTFYYLPSRIEEGTSIGHNILKKKNVELKGGGESDVQSSRPWVRLEALFTAFVRFLLASRVVGVFQTPFR